jgi:uncharacterized protein (TIGR02145 family)
VNRAIKTGLAAILLLAVSCKKENNTIQSSDVTNKSSAHDDLVTGSAAKYDRIKIGSQVWLQKNLAVSHYQNGDKIPQVKDPAKWGALTTGAWCWYNNDSATGAIYGKLYNWYAVNDPRGLAPTGWHVPGNAEWDTLLVYLANNPGGKLKDTGTIEAGTGLWHAPNFNATNESGFTGFPGGYHSFNGTFYVIGNDGYWWSSTERDIAYAWYRHLSYISRRLGNGFGGKANGFSVRCIKD